jgi:hypothetical protein
LRPEVGLITPCEPRLGRSCNALGRFLGRIKSSQMPVKCGLGRLGRLFHPETLPHPSHHYVDHFVDPIVLLPPQPSAIRANPHNQTPPLAALGSHHFVGNFVGNFVDPVVLQSPCHYLLPRFTTSNSDSSGSTRLQSPIALDSLPSHPSNPALSEAIRRYPALSGSN